MVTPVLHVLPLTFRLIFQLLFCCVLSGTFCEGQGVTMPYVALRGRSLFAEHSGKKFPRLRRAEGSLHHRLRRA